MIFIPGDEHNVNFYRRFCYGGLVGDIASSYVSVITCYYDKNITKMTDTGKGDGKSTEEMMTIYTNVPWSIAAGSNPVKPCYTHFNIIVKSRFPQLSGGICV